MAESELAEDAWWNSFANDEAEVRFTVTMIPQLPQVNTTESQVFVIENLSF